MPNRDYKPVRDHARHHYRPLYCPRAPGLPVQITTQISYDQFMAIEVLAKARDCTRASLLAKVIARGLEGEKA